VKATGGPAARARKGTGHALPTRWKRTFFLKLSPEIHIHRHMVRCKIVCGACARLPRPLIAGVECNWHSVRSSCMSRLSPERAASQPCTRHSAPRNRLPCRSVQLHRANGTIPTFAATADAVTLRCTRSQSLQGALSARSWIPLHNCFFEDQILLSPRSDLRAVCS
jgi:hypothetical protein